MTYQQFAKCMKTLNEFAFQINKIFSLESNFDYELN